MDGLIVKQPYASQLVSGLKKVEFRTTRLPVDKIGQKVLIITPQKDGGLVLGHVVFNEEKQTGNIYKWIVKNAVSFDKPWRYNVKPGCVIWMKDVGYDIIA